MHTVEANYYVAFTLLNISFYYIYLSCRGKRSVWHSSRKVPSFETFCDSQIKSFWPDLVDLRESHG